MSRTRNNVATQIPAKRLLLATCGGFVTAEFAGRLAMEAAIASIQRHAKIERAAQRQARRNK